MAPLVDVAGVSYRYPDAATAALVGVDLVLDGGLCVVAGPSGGGKSTLLRLLNGLVPHMYGGRISGRARVDSHDVLRTPARRMATSVGFVFQDAERQAVHATVERDIAFGLENRGVPQAEMRCRVEDVMSRLGIAHLRARAIATLSGGERQRVAVAGALVLRPRLLVLDEPFSQLDAEGGRALLALMLELRDSGTALAVAEHRLDDLLRVADGVLDITHGRIRGPAPAASLAASLDSAPQVVRLCAAMGWTPTLLDPDAARSRVAHLAGRPLARTSPPAASGNEAWRLDGVVGGPGGVLRGVDAAARTGEVVALMGDNGAGKTTLLRVIAGLITPSAGTAWRAPGRVAYLPQNPAALLFRESVEAEIAWTLRDDPGHRPDDPEHLALLRTLGIEAIAGRDPRDLSSGQRQRAAIAAILCGLPRVALLDEPTRGMDGAAREGLVRAVRSLAARGASVVVATHDSDLAASVADRVLVIEAGLLNDLGAPAWALSGARARATQLGALFASPGPVTVEDLAALLGRHRLPVAAPR